MMDRHIAYNITNRGMNLVDDVNAIVSSIEPPIGTTTTPFPPFRDVGGRGTINMAQMVLVPPVQGEGIRGAFCDSA